MIVYIQLDAEILMKWDWHEWHLGKSTYVSETVLD